MEVTKKRMVYHERQRLYFCGQHTLNNLFQDKVFTKEQLDNIALKLAEKTSLEIWTWSSYFVNPHKSLLGNYDVNVLEMALREKDLEVKWFDVRKDIRSVIQFADKSLFGLILNIPSSQSTTALTPTILSSMKRSELQKLCRKYGIKANGKNIDLKKKLQQYALNSERSDSEMEDILMTDVDQVSDLDQSSRRNHNLSEPVTPQTPSAIPLEQQNKIRSLVEETPSKVKSTYQNEIKGIEAVIDIHDYKTPITSSSKSPTTKHLISTNAPEPCLSLILYNKPIFPNFVKEQEDNAFVSKKESVNTQQLVTDTNNVTDTSNVMSDGTLEIAEKQNTEQLTL
ncbi:11883_t:CDS:2, partial [Funneliformis geosporum]